jgi:ubiquinone/menaquinone biosynthesis C-methylase UbiE
VDGVVWCEDCRQWYPIEGRLLDLLIGPLAYADDRARFWSQNEARLRTLELAPESEADTSSKALQKHQQRHFDWYAENEDQSYFEYEHTPFWQAADLIAFEPWKRAIAPGSWLLDVGCAQGRSTFKFMDCDIQIVAFDVSKALVRQAIARYQAGEHRARAVFLAADASRFPLRDGSFDTVLVYGVLHHLADPGIACQEISRVLAPGGSYIGQENNQSLFRGIFDALQWLIPQWHEEAGPEAIISSQRLREWFRETPSKSNRRRASSSRRTSAT